VRRFVLRRLEDVNGVSGLGVVVEGVQFSDGACAIRWISGTPSTTHHDTVENVIAVHGHNGKTVLEWIDPAPAASVTIPVKLGWSNPDTGPESMRLYALDAGDQPRWAEPHARVAETAIRELVGLNEGARGVLVMETERRNRVR
jgi:hypothetical protein